MSSQYTTEPPPTATVLLHTTAGPLTVSLFAQQTPLTCRNFLQQCLDGTYSNTIFHRVVPGFIIQTGDPTGTGEGGTNIYEDGDRSLEKYGETWGRMLRLPEERYDERIILSDEPHSRLKFNRRGLVGMARMKDSREGEGQYGTQFFVTLADTRAELDGKCTMFGRIEGDGIYNVMKIANAELVEGAERPVYPEKILRVEVLDMPEGPAWKLTRREKVAATTAPEPVKKKDKVGKKKGGKTLLSFGGDGDLDGEDGASVAVRPKKAKFNTALIDSSAEKERSSTNGTVSQTVEAPKSKKRKSPEPTNIKKSPEPEPKRRKPSFHESTTQLPLRDPESPSRSPTPELPSRRRSSNHKSASAYEAEIAALKASMKRDSAPVAEPKQKLSALEALIPATSTRGRKRPRPGENQSGSGSSALKLLNAFKTRLENAETSKKTSKDLVADTKTQNDETPKPDAPDEEAALCDLHFIANCQSCSDWADDQNDDETDAQDRGFLGHSLTFEKDRLGKDLTWKQKNEEELVVIDPREREKELGIKSKSKGTGKGREWDKDRDKHRDRPKERQAR